MAAVRLVPTLMSSKYAFAIDETGDNVASMSRWSSGGPTLIPCGTTFHWYKPPGSCVLVIGRDSGSRCTW